MKNKTLKILGLVILITGLALGLAPQAGFAALPTPTNLQITSLEYNANNTASVKLTWGYPAGADISGFCVQYTTIRGDWYGCQSPIWDPNARTTDKLLLNINTTYYFRVIAVRGNWLEYTISAELTYFLPPPTTTPAAPSNLIATAISSNQINLTWQDKSNNETGFKLERKSGAGGTYGQIVLLGANVTTYSDTTGLTVGTTYYYRIKATNSAGDSGYSNEAYATTPQVYSISGVAKDQSNNNLSGVTVSFYNTSGSKITETTTDANGRYSQNLGVGAYDIKATKADKTIEPNIKACNPVKLEKANVDNVDFRFCGDPAKTKKIVYVHGAGKFRDWDYPQCQDGKCYEIYKFRWGGVESGEKEAHYGLKTLKDFGNDLNKFIKDNKIDEGGEFTILAHSFGTLIARAAIIRAQEEEGKETDPKVNYSGVNLVLAAPMIGGDYRVDLAPAFWPNSQGMSNMDPDGATQTWLYGKLEGEELSGHDKLIQKINENGKSGRIKIILAKGDDNAPPYIGQTSNKYMSVGIKEDTDGAPNMINTPTTSTNPELKKPHNAVLDSPVINSLVMGVNAGCGWNAVEVPKPNVVYRSHEYSSLSGGQSKVKLEIINLGASATNVKVRITNQSKGVTIIRGEYSFGNMNTGEVVDNSSSEFIIEEAWWRTLPFMFGKIPVVLTFTIITDEGTSLETRSEIKKVMYVIPTPPNPFKRSSLENKVIKFVRNTIGNMLALGANQALAQESPENVRQLYTHPTLADLNKDGKMEVILPLAGRKVYVLKSDGTDFWTAPYIITDSGCTSIYPAVADINNDGELEVIIAEYGADVLRILDKNGNLLRFISDPRMKVGMPAVADIDNSVDGKMEIVVAKDGVVSLIDSEGRILWSKTNLTGYTPSTSAPVLIDLNGDGSKEIISGDVCVLDKNGNILWSKPSSGGVGCSVADLNNDGQAEIVSGSGSIFKYDGTLLLKLFGYNSVYPPVIADLNGDNLPEVIALKEIGYLEVYYNITPDSAEVTEYAYDPYALEYYPAALYDMDKDGNPEIILATNSDTSGALYFLGFIDSQIQLIEKCNVGYKITHTPIMADINKDGITEVVIADLISARDNSISFYPAGISEQGAIFWPQFQRDTLRTGLYDIQPPQLSAIGNKTANGGQILSFTVSATDQLVGKLSFSAYPLPQGATLINNGNGTATFSWTPSSSQAGTYRLTFVVSDGLLNSSEAITITANAIAAPTCLIAQGTFTDKVNLWWWDNSANATGFKIERSTDGRSWTSFLVGPSQYNHHLGPEYRAGCTPSGSSCWSDAVGCLDTCCGPVYNMVEYWDRGLDFGKKYYYRVKATNGVVDSNYSNVTSPVTADPSVIQFGFLGTVPVPGDYDGDGRADLAVYYPAAGNWYIRTVPGTVLAWGVQWGTRSMTPVSGDYDGDRKADLALFDPPSGKWYIRTISGTVLAWGVPWGTRSMVPVAGDYNGDSIADLALFDPPSGKWYIRTISGIVLAWGVPWGTRSMTPVSGDYDGDRRADLALFDPASGKWYIKSLVNTTPIAWALPWGFSGTKPISGDYDGDAKADLAIYHPAANNWYIRTIAGAVLAYPVKFGSGQEPVSGDFNKDGKSELVVYNSASGNWYIKTLGTR